MRPALFLWCRQGFERDLAAELAERTATAGLAAYVRTEPGSGFAVLHGDDPVALDAALPWQSLVFARQKLAILAELADLPAKDRISPILDALRVIDLPAFGGLSVEHPDSDSGKPLAGLCRSFADALRPALRKYGFLLPRETLQSPRLVVAFTSGQSAFLTLARPGDSAPWPLGIVRLKMHADAPSRSALKLEEALLTLLDENERERLIQPGMRAADLGAAPGGWTWVLTRHGLHVTAIDNGPLRPHVLDTGLVTHLREDGFRWQPREPLNWMVCDMVEQPIRVAVRMAEWFRHGWCDNAVFNLKLPMKKRWLETRRCLDAFRQQAGALATLRARQLYHDREEITVFARRKP